MAIDPAVYRWTMKYAPRYGVDPYAALAVSTTEGGGRRYAVGDQGTSFGPWQLHRGGALPAGKGRLWAGSEAGVHYAIRQMSKVSRGKRGKAAIHSIVHEFERPRHDLRAGNVAKAWARYGGLQKGYPSRTNPTFSGPPRQRRQRRQAGTGNQMALAQALMKYASGGNVMGLVNAIGAYKNPVFQQPRQQTAMPNFRGGGASPMPMGSAGRPLRTPMGSNSEYGSPDAEGAPSARGGRYHAAKDWFAPGGSPVYSPVNGKIVEVKASRGNSGQIYGGVVKVQAPNGRVFVFRHVNPAGVRVGQRVRKNQPVARVTPWTGGKSHAHIEIWKTLRGGYRYENMLDPVKVFRGLS